MSDQELRKLTQAFSAAQTAYESAANALRDYYERATVQVAREAKADPATLERVREAVEHWLLCIPPSREWSSAAVAQGVARLLNTPSAKTLQNVYLPAIREDCAHAVQVGREWMWFRNAKQLASRDTGHKG
jgi:hypothetical protein